MQFALVDGVRTAPAPKMTGLCPACGSPVIAKCGTIRVHHWSHRGERNCDPWWERETQWHRDWKNKFPVARQETVLFDETTGEKHIADVFTEQSLTVEFQHSHLRPDERMSREAFYKKMVWVVDGARLVRDRSRFEAERSSFLSTSSKGLFLTHFPQHAFPKNWLDCSAPVFFDFHDTPELQSRNGPLVCLLPGRAFEYAVIVFIERDEFVRLAETRAEPIPATQILDQVRAAIIAAEKARMEEAKRAHQREMAYRMARARQNSWKNPYRRRRF